MKLIYSPEEHGYYWQMQGPTDWRVTKVYRLRSNAERARRRGQLVFK
jgi:hypothetical protein